MNTHEDLRAAALANLRTKLEETEQALAVLAEETQKAQSDSLKERGSDAEPTALEHINHEANIVSQNAFGQLKGVFSAIRDAASTAAGQNAGFARPFQKMTMVDASLAELNAMRKAAYFTTHH